MTLPETLNIVGIEYKIEYVDNPAEVDIHKRKSLWGQIDYWTRTIRIYKANRTIEDIWQTIVHESLHGIASDLHLGSLDKEESHNDIDVLALALTDMLFRNGLIKQD